MDTFVLIGGGLAGAKAAETLRAEGFAGRVVLVAEEPEIPYERPPLSKGYLLGNDEREKARVHEAGWYEENDVELRTGTRAVALDVGEPAGGAGLGGVARLRQAAAGHRLVAAAACPCPAPTWTASTTCARCRTPTGCSPTLRDGGRRIVIVGAGWIGLEVAAAARTLRQRRRPSSSRSPPRCTQRWGRRWARSSPGCTGSTTSTCAPAPACGSSAATGGSRSVVTDGGDEIPADLVLVGVGRGAEHRARRGGRARGRPRHRHRRGAADVGARRLRRRRRRQLVPSALRPARPRRALGQRAQRRPGGGALDARPGRQLRPGALLLHRPVRPRHGVLRARRAGRHRRLPRQPRGRRVRRVLALRREGGRRA